MNCIAFFRQRIDKPKKILILQAVFIATVLSYFVLPGNEIQSSGRRMSTISDDGRPIMHTFYQQYNDGEADLLIAWKEEWTKAGFDARVLKLEDAKRHPYFEQMKKVVEPIMSTYNRYCIYRWLAMAASGGGWMCDYDTFPINFPTDEAKKLPNNGTLTSFESHVPSLVSGTSEEWTRVAKLLVEAIPRMKDVTGENLKSDMHCFLTLKTEGTHNVDFRPARPNIREGFIYKNALGSDSPREVDCRIMAKGRVVHLAHRYSRESYEKGMFPLQNMGSSGEALRNRGKAARIFMADWRDQCGGSNVK